MKQFFKRLSVLAALVITGMALTTASAADKVVIDGSSTVGPIAKAFAGFYMQKTDDVNVTVSITGRGNGAKSLIHGRCDIADMSRFMKPGEFKSAVDSGVYPVFHTVAMDGIAMVVHPSNPVSKLTLDQIRKIYVGRIDNWREVGGPDKKITVVSRDTTSGTYEVFCDIALDGESPHNVEYVPSNAASRARISKTQGAIGYVGLGFTDDVKVIKVNGVTPTLKTVGSGKYPIARPLFMVTDGFPELGSHVQQILAQYLTRQGQEMIKGIGYVPVTQY